MIPENVLQNYNIKELSLDLDSLDINAKIVHLAIY